MKTKLHLCLFTIIFLGSYIHAQWSNNPAVNLAVCDTAGEQALPKVASTSDGGCYISWFDNRSGSYAVYMQRLDPLGNKLWGSTGLLVSSNPQSTSLVDYDLMADADDYAIIAFTDTRNGGNLNVFTYRISPNGDFIWGADGISLSGSNDYQANPKLVQTDDGYIVVAWIIAPATYQVGLQKLSLNGNKQWGTNPIVLQSASEGYNYPDVVPSDSGGVILFHTGVTGSFPAQTVKLRAKKITSAGTVSWGVNIQDLGRITPFNPPKVYSDNSNGGLVAWYDDRDLNNLQSAFVQRVSSNGSLYFPIDGAEASLMPSRHKFSPVAAFDNTTNETFVFWLETDANQNQHGVSGQKLSVNGIRQWTDNAKVFRVLSSPNTISISYMSAEIGNAKAYLFYLEGNAGGLNDLVQGFACNSNGDFLWPGNIVSLSNNSSDKLHMVSAVDIYKNCKLAWDDNRSGSSSIYGQDINPNGELGNSVTPVELNSFIANVNGSQVILSWSTASEKNNMRFEVERSQSSNVKGKREWLTIGYIQGNGTSTEFHMYSFADKNLSAGKYSYRLKQIDYDGSYTYHILSEIVEVGFTTNFELAQNYPNPFNPATTIRYTIPFLGENERGVFVTLKVYDILGNEVVKLVDESKSSGSYELNLDAGGLSSGVYYYRISIGEFSSTRKMILLR